MISTDKLLKIIDTADSIEYVVEQVPNFDFICYLNLLMQDLNITKSELIKKTILDRNYAYQIFNGTKNPNRNKVIQIAIALQVGLKETNNLLSLSNNGSLYPKVKRDAVIILSLKRHLNVMETNDLLHQLEYELLD